LTGFLTPKYQPVTVTLVPPPEFYISKIGVVMSRTSWGMSV